MKKRVLAFALIFFSTISYADTNIKASDLVKVDASNKSTCVEYYLYQGSAYCSLKGLQSNSIDPVILHAEKQNIIFDNRPWKLAWGKQTNTITTIEYVPMGDDINNWNELITSQFIPTPQGSVSLKAYIDKVKQDLIDTGFKTQFNIIQESPTQLVFEFQVTDPENQRQDEIQKVMQTANSVYILHYVIKKSDMGDDNRKKWISNLMQSSIKG